jgi:hypothetical protein
MVGRGIAILSVALISTAGLVGCKATNEVKRQVPPEGSNDAEISDGDTAAVIEKERTASAVSELRRSADFFFQIWNQRYEVNFNKLNAWQTGSVATEKRPFSGFWYPERTGGTNVGGALGRYDRAFNGGRDLAAAWERANHTRPASDKDAGWAGHCNGWAASAQRHAEPRFCVVYKNGTYKADERCSSTDGVLFTQNDIKALLAELYMNANSVFLGGTRCGSRLQECVPSTPDGRPDPTKLDSYQDVNPAAFHVVLTNWVGRFKHAIIFDERNDKEVWNYPIYGYSYNYTSIPNANEAQARVSSSDGRGYKFNPEATKFVEVTMTITFTAALGGEATAGTYPNHRAQEPKPVYRYILELNNNDEIIGGEWHKDYVNNHPDFVWVALEPGENQAGSKEGGNPHLSSTEVIKMWAESIGADVNNPPTDIQTPNYQSNWGKFPEFTVTLDGSNNGAVYLSPKTKISIQRTGRLAEKISLELGLNDLIIQTLNLEAGEVASAEFESPIGLNRLAFIWKQTGTDPYNTYLRYVALR